MIFNIKLFISIQSNFSSTFWKLVSATQLFLPINLILPLLKQRTGITSLIAVCSTYEHINVMAKFYYMILVHLQVYVYPSAIKIDSTNCFAKPPTVNRIFVSQCTWKGGSKINLQFDFCYMSRKEYMTPLQMQIYS